MPNKKNTVFESDKSNDSCQSVNHTTSSNINKPVNDNTTGNINLTFEEALKKLESITQSLERGDTSLEESINFFEEGINLSRFCSERLKDAEGKIQKLVETTNSSVILEDFSLNNKEE